MNVVNLINDTTIKPCSLDPVPAVSMRKCFLVPVFQRIINLSLSLREMPEDLKIAMLSPVLKRYNNDCESFTNFRPVSNLKFLSKLIEKCVYGQLNKYFPDNDLNEKYQSAYRGLHISQRRRF